MQKDQTFPGGDFVAFDPIQCDLIRDGVDSLKHVSNLEIGILKSKNRDRFVWGADEHVQRTQWNVRRFPIQSVRTVTFITEPTHYIESLLLEFSQNSWINVYFLLFQTPEKLTPSERQVPC